MDIYHVISQRQGLDDSPNLLGNELHISRILPLRMH